MGLHKLETLANSGTSTGSPSSRDATNSANVKANLKQTNSDVPDDDHSGPPPSDDDESSSTGDDGDEDESWGDWVSDSEQEQPCVSLFDGSSFASVREALKHDKEKHGFDLEAFSKHLDLDSYGRIRLINYVRKEKPSISTLNSLTGIEDFFTSDTYLIPVLENDPLIQLSFDDSSEEEDDEERPKGKGKAVSAPADKNKLIKGLTKKLEKARKDLVDYRAFVAERFLTSRIGTELSQGEEPSASNTTASSQSTARTVSRRDDDTHYFDSYGLNDIHSVMLRDKVRTVTYANFILSSPSLFQDAIVLDVGCGTGILSLFAARAGARRVFAVDASENIAERARKIVKLNGLDDIVTVINGKVEDIALPDGITQVDVIISEWMGYALLYESMLDSVLVARDRFLKPAIPKAVVERGRLEGGESGGVMVPSQCRMFLGLCSATDIFKERVAYWSDVYGYDMSPMADEVYDDAIADIVGPETLVTEPVIVKDLDIAHVSTRQLSFSAPFTLRSSTPRRQVAHAFILYFDTFFDVSGAQVSPDARADIAKDGEMHLAEVWRVGGARAVSPSVERKRSQSRSRSSILSPSSRFASPPPTPGGEGSSPSSPPMSPGMPHAADEKRAKMRRASSFKSKDGREKEREPPKETVKSFTTGPQSTPTHWKQTLFLLREPILMQHGAVVEGTFHCRKSSDNSRELDVEIHYSLPQASEDGGIRSDEPARRKEILVQTFKVR